MIDGVKLRQGLICTIAGLLGLIASELLAQTVPQQAPVYPDGYHCDNKLPLPFISISNLKSSISLHHMGLYANSELLDWFKSEYPEHSKTKLDMGKGCIKFKKFNEIPYKLIGVFSKRMTVKNWIDTYEQNIKR